MSFSFLHSGIFLGIDGTDCKNKIENYLDVINKRGRGSGIFALMPFCRSQNKTIGLVLVISAIRAFSYFTRFRLLI